ncbi:MAG: MobF family relaxase [Reichenbachiella sp.]|uniref:MobF family relaxase n=1 Tax=Reichenbachiella sp. TaxID=2184521 RepID=UPI002966A58F|nr:MobF family relaxase [Reichenbachiella sp.]MDW3210279.1 MobF family relaxase [Reichenbachiella sp.]
MMRITASANAKAASGYHKTSLRKQGEYYKEEIEAFWNGNLATRLGLKNVTLENFDALVHNQIPDSKERLTPITKDNRKVGWDITTLPPKSFSVLSALTDDPEFITAFKYANREMMLEAERLILAQANTQYGRFYEHTGNGCWAEFHHRIGRPVEHVRSDGKKVFAGQPLEHIHNFLISATYSKERNKILAIDPYLIFKSAPYLQSYFHNILSNKMVELGYKVERTQDAWEIVGVPKSILERFSERSKIVDRLAQEKNVTDPKEKAKLAALSRVSKNKSVPENKLYDLWKDQLSKEEFEALQNIKGEYKGKSNSISVKEAIDRSLSHFLQKNSIAEEKRVLGHAMALSFGSGHSPADFEKELNSRDNILKSEENNINIITTREMVHFEDFMISLATEGKGKFKPLNSDYKIKRDFLNKDQKNAVKQILSSSDQIVALEGKAGSGKSTLLQELADGLRAVNKIMTPIAPSSQAVEVLRKEGFSEAQTIAAFLINPELQQSIRENVICVDEASMCGVKTKSEILKIAKEQNARVILSGNIGQHASPGEYGDALRILQQAKIKTIHVKQNMRQQPSDYKKAVDLISNRKTLEGYQILDKKMKAVQEIPDHDERLNKIADDYIASIKAKRSALIVSPTNFEKDQISELIRKKQKAAGRIKGQERTFDTLKDLSLSESQKKDLVNYQKGHVVRFIKNQKAKDNKSGFKAGSHYEILPREKKDKIMVRDLKTKQVLTLPHDKPEYYSIYQKTKINIATGDLIKPTVNLKSKEKTKINNGTPQIVKGFVGSDIKLENGKTLAKDSYHLAHNYASTSFSAQGKTCQDVYISMSEASRGAINDQAFYVAVSRGRSRIQLYTDDKKELKSAIVRSGERKTAREVANEHERRLLEQKQRAHHQSMNKKIENYAVSRQRQNEVTRDISSRI